MQKVFGLCALILVAIACVVAVLFGGASTRLADTEPKPMSKSVSVPNQILTAPETPLLLKICHRKRRPPCEEVRETEEP